MPPRSNGPCRSAAQVEADMLRIMAELRMMLQTDALPAKLIQVMLGYAHPQSTGFLKAKAKFSKCKFIKVSQGSIQLTAEGILALPEDITPPRNNSDCQERFRELLLQRAKPKEKFNLIFNTLLDGQVHTKADLLALAGYKHPQSTGFLKSMAALKEFDLLDKSVGAKSVRLNDTVFPLGRKLHSLPTLPPASPAPSSVSALSDETTRVYSLGPGTTSLPGYSLGLGTISLPGPMQMQEAAILSVSHNPVEPIPACPSKALMGALGSPSVVGRAPFQMEEVPVLATSSDCPAISNPGVPSPTAAGASFGASAPYQAPLQKKKASPMANARGSQGSVPKKRAARMKQAASALGFSFRPLMPPAAAAVAAAESPAASSDPSLPPLQGSISPL